MRYRCKDCGVEDWREFFPERTFHWRYAVFHGVAMGVMSILARGLFRAMEYEARGPLDAVIALVVGGAILVSLYGIAIGIEAFVVAERGCRSCGSQNVELAS